MISTSDIRYLGRLIGVDTKNHTVTLADVKSMGTEGRRKAEDEVPSSPETHAYIVFRGADVKDLTIIEANQKQIERQRHNVVRRRRPEKPRANDCLAAELTDEMRIQIKTEFDFATLNVNLEDMRPKEKPAEAVYDPSKSFFDQISYSCATNPERKSRRPVPRSQARPIRGTQPSSSRRYVRRSRP